MKVVELRAELKSRGLPVGGLKAALIQRLQDYDEPADAAPDGRLNEERPEDGDQDQNQDQDQDQEPAENSTAGATKPAKYSVKATAAAAAAGDDRKTASPAESESKDAAATSAAAAANSTAPELKSTRSKTRRASMAATAATTTKPPAIAAAVSVNSPAANATATAKEPAERGNGGGGTAGAAAAATAGEGAVDENSEMQIMLAKGAGLLGLGISAACIVWGDGLTAGNLAMLHVALAGLFMAATAVNTRPRGARAFAARAIVTLAVALVASEALRQVQQPAEEAQAAGVGGESGMASLLSLVSGAAEPKAETCENPAAADGEDDGVAGDIACLEAAEIPLTALEASLAWATSAWSVLEGDAWRAVRFGVIEFWGWASVAGYVTLVEALPVMLQPLHGFFRRLERGHNVLLAVTSFAMLVGIISSCVTSGKTGSVHAMLCAPFDEHDPVFDLTSKVFFWSKAWEWFDTALLVAKGKPVSWLQYTHHASTAILTALNMVPMRNAMWSVVCSLNSFVHTWMYAYYGLPRFRLLRRSKVWLTWAQMLQHMIVLASAAYVVFLAHTSEECHNNTTPILAGLGLYGMYLAFFALFYRRTYGGTSSRGKREKISKAA
eukprot:g14043.t1